MSEKEKMVQSGAETSSDRAETKKKRSPGRDERGRFTKGNKISENQLFKKENAVACKYKPEYADKLIEYFSQPATRVEYAKKFDKDGNVVGETPVVLPNDYPTFEGFAASIGVHTDTLRNWCETSRRFRYCYVRAREMQKGKLITNTLSGFYNPQFAKFEAINNHGMTEKTQQDASLVLSVKMPEEIDEESF